MDEDHSLRLAMRRLASDADAARIARRSRTRATGSGSIRSRRMVEDYERARRSRGATPRPHPALPAHLVNDGERSAASAAGRWRCESAASGINFDDTTEWETVRGRRPAHDQQRCSPISTSIPASSRSSTTSSSSNVSRYDTTMVSEGDEIEIVNFVGGG